ncbi:hypothetical protein F443_21466 [Phytophthora nicotianae P1569]|uniref:Uncharacterized protein n=2 Tax=Phytophthora nicotianae TaxID=4792 RepID=V9DXH0_PHYNI|nr:hypothetical protein F443_21466 [Phytophthora nicotianae P1569]
MGHCPESRRWRSDDSTIAGTSAGLAVPSSDDNFVVFASTSGRDVGSILTPCLRTVLASDA